MMYKMEILENDAIDIETLIDKNKNRYDLIYLNRNNFIIVNYYYSRIIATGERQIKNNMFFIKYKLASFCSNEVNINTIERLLRKYEKTFGNHKPNIERVL